MKPNIRTCIWLVAALLALATASGAMAADKSRAKAEALFKERSYDFGTVPERGGRVTHDFEFVNSGDGNLVILDASAECGCTTPKYPEQPVPPGGKGVVSVTYDPVGRPGTFSRTVTVKTNGDPRKIRLKITGRVQ